MKENPIHFDCGRVYYTKGLRFTLCSNTVYKERTTGEEKDVTCKLCLSMLKSQKTRIVHYRRERNHIISSNGLVHSICGTVNNWGPSTTRVNREKYQRDILNITCKSCLRCLALKVGLKVDTPAFIICDKIKEDGLDV